MATRDLSHCSSGRRDTGVRDSGARSGRQDSSATFESFVATEGSSVTARDKEINHETVCDNQFSVATDDGAFGDDGGFGQGAIAERHGDGAWNHLCLDRFR